MLSVGYAKNLLCPSRSLYLRQRRYITQPRVSMNEPSEFLRHPGSHGPKPSATSKKRSIQTNIAESQPHPASSRTAHPCHWANNELPALTLRLLECKAISTYLRQRRYIPQPRVSMNEPSEFLRHPGSHGPKPSATSKKRSIPTNIAESQPSYAGGQNIHAVDHAKTVLSLTFRRPTPTALHNTAQGKHERAERVPAPPWGTRPQKLCDERKAIHPNKHRRVAITSGTIQSPARGQSIHATGQTKYMLCPSSSVSSPRLGPIAWFVAFWPIVVTILNAASSKCYHRLVTSSRPRVFRPTVAPSYSTIAHTSFAQFDCETHRRDLGVL